MIATEVFFCLRTARARSALDALATKKNTWRNRAPLVARSWPWARSSHLQGPMGGPRVVTPRRNQFAVERAARMAR